MYLPVENVMRKS